MEILSEQSIGQVHGIRFLLHHNVGINLRGVDAGMPKKFDRRVDVCSAVRVIVAKVWRLVWKVTSLLIPARFAMFFKALLAAPSFGALGKTNWSLASFGLSCIHDFAFERVLIGSP